MFGICKIDCAHKFEIVSHDESSNDFGVLFSKMGYHLRSSRQFQPQLLEGGKSKQGYTPTPFLQCYTRIEL